MGRLADRRACPPTDGDIWKLLFARYEKFNPADEDVHTGWAWNRVGSRDNHAPECFTHLHFSIEMPPSR